MKGDVCMIDKTGKDGDTVKLLRECDAGIKMGISSINDVIDDVKDEKFRSILNDCRKDHEALSTDIENELKTHNDEGKAPNVMAKSMSWVKTNIKMMVDFSDNTVADLMTDGCNMGVKSLSKYLNQYQSADGKSKGIAKKLIKIEDTLAQDMRAYL